MKPISAIDTLRKSLKFSFKNTLHSRFATRTTPNNLFSRNPIEINGSRSRIIVAKSSLALQVQNNGNDAMDLQGPVLRSLDSLSGGYIVLKI